jgi:hypothetical protein
VALPAVQPGAGVPGERQLAAPVHPDVPFAHCHACLHSNFKTSNHTIAHSTRKQNLLPCPQVVDFKHGSVHRVVVVSYETLRKHAAELAGCVDLLVCDEGHRCGAAGGGAAPRQGGLLHLGVAFCVAPPVPCCSMRSGQFTVLQSRYFLTGKWPLLLHPMPPLPAAG